MKDSHDLLRKIIDTDICLEKVGLEEKIKKYDLIKYPELYNFAHDEKQIKNIISLLRKLQQCHVIDEKDIVDYIVSLLTHKTHYGFLCELLTLSYLQRNKVEFDVEVKVDSSKLLSKNNVALDGYIENIDTYFDVKGFGLQQYAKVKFIRLIEPYFPGSSILIDGFYDVNYADVENYAFKDKVRIVDELKDKGRCSIYEINWTVRTSTDRVTSSIGEMNPYCEAENNKNFIFRKCSQFTKDSPFILICTFENQFNCNLVTNFSNHTDIMTRSLARRAFIEFNNSTEMANTIDSKCGKDVTLSQASKSLSGILFLDAYNDKSWMYLNPNAYNKLDRYKLERAFDFRLPYEMYVDDFQNDNY
ncbi:hypothetical protein CWN94_10580 [Vibrio splendidus]|nr:hypothetical protein CWN94_10580 [Vibrio splendidus]